MTVKQTIFLVIRFLFFAVLLYIVAEIVVSCCVAVYIAATVLLEFFITYGHKILYLTYGQELLETHYATRTAQMLEDLTGSATMYVLKASFLIFALGSSIYLTVSKFKKYKAQNTLLN